ncbi:glycosyltransferase [Halospeciosus flavus]|uniref:Glycosyltransferase n=1 Tax=Halospeciosus flavus TaxID=3032283 RepID=A0ABD5Z3J2_9EURY|nr:glycosyltransferase [Halospeciosus flavus]
MQLASALDAPLYTERVGIEVDSSIDVRTFEVGPPAALDRLPFTEETNRILAYENFEVPAEHDAVITTGIFARSIIHHPYQRRYHLLHTPTRWLFDRGTNLYADGITPIKWFQRLYQSIRRVHEQSIVPRIDDFVVNSEVIARRLQTYYRRNSTAIIYPPVEIGTYVNMSREGFLFHVGRLETAKGIESMIEAVNGTDWTLKLAGTGTKEPKLRSKAGENVEFLGFVSEERKRELLATCDALLFNAEHEDFGIVPVEALASGKPVVAVNEGFTKYQIEEGVNGVLFERGVKNMRDAIERMYRQEWSADQIQQTAERYSKERCINQWQELLQGEG